jgi:glycogen debranching enzyme
MSYHNGSVWPQDNALKALGLAKYGLKAEPRPGIRRAARRRSDMDLRRLPELFCGFQRARSRGPTLYPVPCSPQAWASGAPFTLIQASRGLELAPVLGEIHFREPQLPPFLNELTVRNLRLGGSSIDLCRAPIW